ncbi:putative outer membrane lipoprotein [Croceicoccus naphthovorans]|nr:putative outer membrane lipoprotein [Croceicoccus naphthovorans]
MTDAVNVIFLAACFGFFAAVWEHTENLRRELRELNVG